LIAILKDISIYAIGDILTKGIGFVAIIFYANFITQNDMGVYGYIMIIVSFFTTFLILGVDNAYARYFFEYKDQYKRKILTTTLFIFLFLWMIVALILPFIFYKELSYFLLDTYNYALAFLLALISLPLKLLASMSNQALRNQFKTKQFVVYNFITTMVSVLSSITLLNFTNLGVASIFLGLIIADFVVLPFRFLAIKDLFIKKADFTILKNILAYGVPFVPASVAYWVFSSADRVMLKSMSSLENVGIYTVAVSLGAVMNLVASVVGQAWSPHAVKTYEEDQEKAKILYIKFLKVLIAMALFLIFCASMLGKEIISFIFPSSYSNVFYPMIFLLIGSGLQITTQVTATGISLAKKTIYLVYITLFISVVNILLNYILIPIYTVNGASFATMISYLLLTFIYTIVSQKFFYLNYDYMYIVKALLLLGVIFFASFMNIYVRISLFIIVLSFLYTKKEKIIEGIK
jgi:O-antigen/teichoic acid export membrane protein